MADDTSASTSTDEQALEAGEHSSSLLELPDGKGMSFSAAEYITTRSHTPIVLFAGAVSSGKTTLLAGFDFIFQKGPFADYMFAGSETLVGFEERNYFATIDSKRETPATERTKTTEMLHLQVRRSDLRAPIRDLLLVDMSGEDFREATNSSAACTSLKIISRADVFVLLIDGKRLVDMESRQSARTEALALLRNCFDSGSLGAASRVDVLITKWDLVEASETGLKDEAVRFGEYLEKGINDGFKSRCALLRLFRVAARPNNGRLKLGFGLDAAFAAWVEPTSRVSTIAVPARSTLLSEYDRFSVFGRAGAEHE